MWGGNLPQGQNYSSNKPQGKNSNPNNMPQGMNMKNYHMQNNPAQIYPPSLQKLSPSGQHKPAGKRLSENSSKNPTHFQMRSNQGYENFLLNNNNSFNNFSNANNINNIMNVNDSFTKQENGGFQLGFDKKDELTDKKSNKNNDSKGLNESGLVNDPNEVKGTERLRKIVMLENNEDINKEGGSGKIKYDLENSYDGNFFIFFLILLSF